MKKKMMILFAMVFVFSLLLAACGETGSEESTKKVTATATMNEGEMPVKVTVDTRAGYSVVFENDGFLLFDGEFDDSTYPLVTATILTEDIYNKYITDNSSVFFRWIRYRT